MTFLFLLSMIQSSSAVEFEKLGSAIIKVLGTKQAMQEKVKMGKNEYDVFFTPDKKRYAVIQNGTYPPNCTHTWVIALDKKAKVKDIRVIEMSCPHAFPTKQASFLSQYKGKSKADLKSLDSSISTVAKATGSSKLTTDAVKRSIKIVSQMTN